MQDFNGNKMADPAHDEFECERCHQVFDIKESIYLDWIENKPCVCQKCAWVYFNTSKATKNEL